LPGLDSAHASITIEEYAMDNAIHDRRRFLIALAAGVFLVWLVAARGLAGSLAYEVPQASVAEAKALVDAGATVIDVREENQFASRHLPNAALVPLEVLQAGIPAWLLATKDQPIVVYCNRGLGHGPAATHLLQAAGFSRVVNLSSGIEGWSAAGMPVAHG
jgi:rhodanese-related sulfurtransferase